MSGKRHLTDGIEIPKSRQDRRKWELQILRNLGGWHHQTSGNDKTSGKTKLKKEYLRRTTTRDKTHLPKTYQMNKYLGCTPC